MSSSIAKLKRAPYARTVNTFYEPSANVRGGSGEIYIVIPENRQFT